MTIQRRQHSGAFKAKVAREAIRGERTVNEIAADYGVHPVQVTQWKRVALEALPDIFSSRRGAKHKDEETLKAALYQQLGQLKVEVDWLKKKRGPCPLSRSGSSLPLDIPRSVSGGNVRCWGWHTPVYTISRLRKARRICISCGCSIRNTRQRRFMGVVG